MPRDGTTEATGTAERVKTFDVVYYRHRDLHLSTNHNSDTEIPFRHISGAHVNFLVQSFCVHMIKNAGGTLSITPIAMTSCSEACECDPSTTFHVLYVAESVVLTEEWRWL